MCHLCLAHAIAFVHHHILSTHHTHTHPYTPPTHHQAGESPLQLGPKAEERGQVRGNPLSFLIRLLLGTAAGFYYFLVGLEGAGRMRECSSSSSDGFDSLARL